MGLVHYIILQLKIPIYLPNICKREFIFSPQRVFAHFLLLLKYTRLKILTL